MPIWYSAVSKTLPTDCKENRKNTHLLYWPAKFLHGIAGANSRQQGLEEAAQACTSTTGAVIQRVDVGMPIWYSAVSKTLPTDCKENRKKTYLLYWPAKFLHGIAGANTRQHGLEEAAQACTSTTGAVIQRVDVGMPIWYSAVSKTLPTDCKENRKKTYLLYWPAKFLHGIAGANSRQQGLWRSSTGMHKHHWGCDSAGRCRNADLILSCEQNFAHWL